MTAELASKVVRHLIAGKYAAIVESPRGNMCRMTVHC